MNKKYLLLIITISLVFSSCFKDNDDELQPVSALEIQNFIWRGLNYYYLYKADTPELANDAFGSQEELDTFLNTFPTPEGLFRFLLSPQEPENPFSILVDDYVALENALGGVTLNNGMEFGLVRYPNNPSNVFGYVRYILPNTDAEAKGLTRGVIFNTVDGQQITDTNFSTVFDPQTYTIGLADFDGENITPTGETVTLSKTEYTENPVFRSRIVDINSQKVGYLMYNAFTRDFDPQLNAVFGQFLAEGIDHLVLDLRYNGGGSVETSSDLCSMITGQFSGQVYYTEEWNEDRQDLAQDGLFNDEISTGEAINSLNLSEVYVLTTGRTASASELVINGLDPYINVIQIGDTTTGKFQASFLLYDAPAPNFSRNQANPNHTYAMLPLVFKTANVNGNTDYFDGLNPDIELGEDYANLGVLGEVDEPLFQAALNNIFPSPSPITPPTMTIAEEISESKASSPLYQIMIADQ